MRYLSGFRVHAPQRVEDARERAGGTCPGM